MVDTICGFHFLWLRATRCDLLANTYNFSTYEVYYRVRVRDRRSVHCDVLPQNWG